MFLSKLWFVSERIPPFLLFSTLIHEIVQTLVYIRKLPPIYRHSTPLECCCLNTPFSIDISPLWGEQALRNLIETFKTS